MARLKKLRKKRTIAQPEITLTPLIDTALTLLIIFMVTTPMIQNSIKVDLPKGNLNEVSVQGGQQDLVVSIDKQEKIYVNSQCVPLDMLQKVIQEQMPSDQSGKKRVWVRVDRGPACTANMLVTVLKELKGIKGIGEVAIATERETKLS